MKGKMQNMKIMEIKKRETILLLKMKCKGIPEEERKG